MFKNVKDVMRGDNQFIYFRQLDQDISFKDKGTLVKIIDFNDLPNGLLGITARAQLELKFLRLK